MFTRSVRLFISLLLVMFSGMGMVMAQGQGPGPGPGPGRPGGGGGGGGFFLPPLLMETTAFEDGGIIPPKYVSRGENVQPGFTFKNAPEGTVSYAIVLRDLDVAFMGGPTGILHWLAWNIPAEAGGIPEGSLPEGSVTGANLMRQNTYMGPGAPNGPRYHHYVFELYALNAKLDLPATASVDELMAALQGKVVAKAAYVGRFRSGE
ncbi:MAG: YbhB/YbcL family Raf kinase inhibitor-like protein [Gammaproteobacteria bacterium]|jgi:Raf kinase inhibitor-like YbhB/YbcL family protein|nr:MAG: YbhB/YbcL family Raf kinase inhibitor-like protein [Gammaproteobacteria bacterium]